MSFGLEWINDIMRWLAQWLPHWDVCEPTHRGVRFRGSLVRAGAMHVEAIEPGVYWWWPATTRCYTTPVVRQSANLPAQSLDTTDGVSVLVSTVLVYEIHNVEKALTCNYDLDDTVREIGAAAAVDSVTARSYGEIRTAFAEGDVDRELRTAARRLLRPYGVRVIEARFTDCARHQCLRAEGSAGYMYGVSDGE